MHRLRTFFINFFAKSKSIKMSYLSKTFNYFLETHFWPYIFICYISISINIKIKIKNIFINKFFIIMYYNFTSVGSYRSVVSPTPN